MIVTANHIYKYRTMLGKISTTAATELQEYMLDHGFIIDEEFLIYVEALTRKYGEAAGALAAQFYDDQEEYWQHINSGGRIGEYKYSGKKAAEIAELPSVEEIASRLQGKTAAQVENEVKAMIKRAAEDTTLKNAIRDGAEFAWVPSGDSCPFCLMLASNGWRRASKKALAGGHAEHIHSNCDCTYVVRFDQNTNVEGYDPEALRAQYDAAEGNTWREKLNSMRRDHYAANKDKINVQKRAAYARRAGTGGQGNGKRPRLRLTAVAASTIIEKVKSGEYSLKLSRQQYDKHVAGTKEYVAYEAGRKKKGLNAQSRLTISYEEAQKIIEEKSGTGIIKVRKDGTPTNVEWITCDKVIGQYCHHGQFYETKKAMIIHGKKGSHIVPHKGNKYD